MISSSMNCNSSSGLFGIDYDCENGLRSILVAGDTILLTLIVLCVAAIVIWLICLIIIVVQCKAATRRRRTVEITSNGKKEVFLFF